MPQDHSTLAHIPSRVYDFFDDAHSILLMLTGDKERRECRGHPDQKDNPTEADEEDTCSDSSELVDPPRRKRRRTYRDFRRPETIRQERKRRNRSTGSKARQDDLYTLVQTVREMSSKVGVLYVAQYRP